MLFTKEANIWPKSICKHTTPARIVNTHQHNHVSNPNDTETLKPTRKFRNHHPLVVRRVWRSWMMAPPCQPSKHYNCVCGIPPFPRIAPTPIPTSQNRMFKTQPMSHTWLANDLHNVFAQWKHYIRLCNHSHVGYLVGLVEITHSLTTIWFQFISVKRRSPNRIVLKRDVQIKKNNACALRSDNDM